MRQRRTDATFQRRTSCRRRLAHAARTPLTRSRERGEGTEQAVVSQALARCLAASRKRNNFSSQLLLLSHRPSVPSLPCSPAPLLSLRPLVALDCRAILSRRDPASPVARRASSSSRFAAHLPRRTPRSLVTRALASRHVTLRRCITPAAADDDTTSSRPPLFVVSSFLIMN